MARRPPRSSPPPRPASISRRPGVPRPRASPRGTHLRSPSPYAPRLPYPHAGGPCAAARGATLVGSPTCRFLKDVEPQRFGFDREVAAPARPPPSMGTPYKLRAVDEDDGGPRIDRSYSQASDVEGMSGDVRGMRVRHESFGTGRIVATDGQGPNAKVTVEFKDPKVGLKRVIARFLMPAEGLPRAP